MATLDTFDSGDYIKVRGIVSDFVRANARPNYEVTFAVPSRRGDVHRGAKRILESHRDAYQVLDETPRSNSRIARMLSYKGPRGNRRILVASFRSDGILEKLLDTYYHEWYLESIIPFIVSEGDPTQWKAQLMNLVGPRSRAVLSSDTIKDSYCIMTTLWEHGVLTVSDKIAQRELIETASRIAASNELNLRVVGAQVS